MRLAPVDLAVLAIYLGVIFVLGVRLSRRAGASHSEFFLAGRNLPWWLAGVSLLATSFSIDTPLGIAGLIDANGLAGVWFAWSFAIGGGGMLGYALFSELWRRSRVMTDAELVELRYGGRPAAGLRAFKAIYFGVFLNALTLAWVLKAITTLGEELFGQPPLVFLALVLTLTLAYSIAAGLWGVVASDVLQYGLVLAAFVVLAARAMSRVGGPHGLMAAFAERYGPAEAEARLDFIPSPGDAVFATFLAYVFVLWWAHKNASAAGAVVQRLAACRDEREARKSTLLFSVGAFALHYWPMIVLSLCALALYPSLPAEQGFVRLLADGIPVGLLGLLLAALLAAFMSTVDSHLNLSASYLVRDLIGRFLLPRAAERTLVVWGRIGTALVLLLAAGISLTLESVASAWTLLAQITSGYGLVTILRWFWWRINAWSEISALASSALATLGLQWWSSGLGFGQELGVVVALSTPVWIAVTLLTRPTPDPVLHRFLEDVEPWGWWGIHGNRLDGLRRRLGVWVTGTLALLALNFAVGAAIFANWRLMAGLGFATAVMTVCFLRLDSAPGASRRSSGGGPGPAEATGSG